jgi:hypothetical protein
LPPEADLSVTKVVMKRILENAPVVLMFTPKVEDGENEEQVILDYGPSFNLKGLDESRSTYLWIAGFLEKTARYFREAAENLPR